MRFRERVVHLLDIVAVNFNDLESQGFQHSGIFSGDVHDVFAHAVALHPVVVQEKREVVQPVIHGGHAGFPDGAFVCFTVAAQHIGLVRISFFLRRQRQSRCHGDALAKAPGGSFHSDLRLHDRMRNQVGSVLHECVQQAFVHDAELRERGIQSQDSVAFAQDKLVLFRVRKIPAVHDRAVQYRHSFHDGKPAAQVRIAAAAVCHFQGGNPHMLRMGFQRRNPFFFRHIPDQPSDPEFLF